MVDFNSSFGSPFLDSSRIVGASRRSVSNHVHTQIGVIVNITFCEYHGHLSQTYMVRLLDVGSDQIIPCRKISPQSSLDGVGDYYPLEEGDPVLILFKEGRADIGYILGGFTSEGDYLKFLVQGKGEEPGNIYDSGLGNVLASPPSIHPDRVATPDAFFNIISSRNLLGDYQDPALGDPSNLKEQAQRRSQPGSIEIKDRLGNFAQYAKGDIVLYSDNDIILLSTKQESDECKRLARMIKYYRKLLADLKNKFVKSEEEDISNEDLQLITESNPSGELVNPNTGNEIGQEEEQENSTEEELIQQDLTETDLSLGDVSSNNFNDKSSYSIFTPNISFTEFNQKNLNNFDFSTSKVSFENYENPFNINNKAEENENENEEQEENEEDSVIIGGNSSNSEENKGTDKSSFIGRQVDRLRSYIGDRLNPEFHQYATNLYHMTQISKLIEGSIKELEECKRNLANYHELIRRLQNGTNLSDSSLGDSSPSQSNLDAYIVEYNPRENACGKTLVETIKNLSSITGKSYGSGTCYEGVGDAIDYAGLGKLGGDCKIFGPNGLINLLSGYTFWAVHFAEFFNENPSKLEKFEIIDLKKSYGIVDPMDSRVPPGAVLVVAQNIYVDRIEGDINIKTDDGRFLNPRSMTFMTRSDFWKQNPNLLLGIYVDAQSYSFTERNSDNNSDSQSDNNSDSQSEAEDYIASSKEEIDKIIEQDSNRSFSSKYGKGIYEVEYNYDSVNWTNADVKAKPIDSNNKPIVILPIQYTVRGPLSGALGRGREWTLLGTQALKSKLESKSIFVLTPDVDKYYDETNNWNEAHNALEFYCAAIAKGNVNVQVMVITADAEQGGVQLLVTATRPRDRSWENAFKEGLLPIYRKNGLKIYKSPETNKEVYIRKRGQPGYKEGNSKAYHPLIERVAQYNSRVGIKEIGTLKQLIEKGNGSLENAVQFVNPVFNKIADIMHEFTKK